MSNLPEDDIMGNEKGFVLVTSLMILLILLIIGVAATNTSNTEVMIAVNEKRHQEAFYEADGGAELASRLSFENAMCYNFGGFTESTANSNERRIGKIRVLDLDFASPGGSAVTVPTDAARDAVYYPESYNNDSDTHTNINVSGVTRGTPGSGIKVGSGYESVGMGAAKGGTYVHYTIYSKHEGLSGTEALIGLEWKLNSYLINSASSFDCKYD